jgi:hypothetical protein
MSSRSRSKRNVRSGSAPPRRAAEKSAARSAEIASAKQRAVATKVAITACGTVVFAAAMVLARHSFAGHPKAPTTALGASPKFLSIVRKNLLAAGVVAPAQAPPGAATAVS